MEVPVNVRILSATHKNLADLVDKGIFRQDLFYRINVIELNVPPLRDRRDDIPLLAEHIMSRLNADMDMETVSLSDAALQSLMTYDFPGNIRELENIIERAVMIADGPVIEASDIVHEGSSSGMTPTKSMANNMNLEEYLTDIEKQAILDALDKTRWNKTAAAKLLGISFRALRYRLDKLGLDD